MIKIENFEVLGWEHAIRGMRNPMNSWEKSDSKYCSEYDHPPIKGSCQFCPHDSMCNKSEKAMQKMYLVGSNDHSLMMKLRNSGTDHRKFMRMITVYVDITAPLYWWKEFDTYKVGTVANSCSTMHKIHAKEFTMEDFSFEHLLSDPDNDEDGPYHEIKEPDCEAYRWYAPKEILEDWIIRSLNKCRKAYLETKDKKYWWQMIQLLPSSYNQKRTVMLNYEVLANIYKSRKDHKLDEWHVLCDWIKTLPYSELIVGSSLEDVPICNEIMAEAEKRCKNEFAR